MQQGLLLEQVEVDYQAPYFSGGNQKEEPHETEEGLVGAWKVEEKSYWLERAGYQTFWSHPMPQASSDA